MSRFSMCPSSVVFSNQACPGWQGEDAARLLRLLAAPVKIAIVALLIGAALALSMQWAQPFVLGPGSAGTTRYAMHSPQAQETDRQVEERVEAFLAELEDPRASANGGGPSQPQSVP